MNMQPDPLFLVWHGAPGAALEIGDPWHPLADALLMVRSARTQSKLYHAIKWQLPDGTPLRVAPLADAPKFKGMADGALAWLRNDA